MEILKIYLEEQLLIKNHEIKKFNIAKDLKHDGQQKALASMVYKSFDKTLSRSSAKAKLCQSKN